MGGCLGRGLSPDWSGGGGVPNAAGSWNGAVAEPRKAGFSAVRGYDGKFFFVSADVLQKNSC